VIARPDWSEDIADAARTGGPAVDLHIHDTHFLLLLAGMPHKVFATGQKDGATVQSLTTQYLYREPNAPALSCSSGAPAMPGRPFVHGFELYLEQATLLCESGTQPLTLLTADGKVKQPRLKASPEPIPAFTRELQAAVDGVQAGEAPDLLRGALARDALLLPQGMSIGPVRCRCHSEMRLTEWKGCRDLAEGWRQG
jgi:predicted dehydrogenase